MGANTGFRSQPLTQPHPHLESRMPGKKGKRSARQCIDGCGSTNPRTIARHTREWQSSVNVRPTRFNVRMSRLASRTRGPVVPDLRGPSDLEGIMATESPRVASWNLSSLILRALTHYTQKGHSVLNRSKSAQALSLSLRTSQPLFSPHTIVTLRGKTVGMMLTVWIVRMK